MINVFLAPTTAKIDPNSSMYTKDETTALAF